MDLLKSSPRAGVNTVSSGMLLMIACRTLVCGARTKSSRHDAEICEIQRAGPLNKAEAASRVAVEQAARISRRCAVRRTAGVQCPRVLALVQVG